MLSGALLVTATFLFSPYTLNYDFVVLAWVLALLRQRPGLVQRDHAVILVIWSLPVTMMIAGLAHIPLGFLALVAFTVWLLRGLAQGEPAVARSWNPFGWRIPAGAG